MVDPPDASALSDARDPAETERFRALLHSSAGSIVVLDPDGTVRFFGGNPGPTLGFSDEDWVGVNAFDLVHPDDHERAAAGLAAALATPGGEAHAEIRVRTAAGTYEWLDVTATNLVDDERVRGLVLTTRNISARKRSDALLAAQAQVLELIARGATLGETLEGIVKLVEDRLAATCAVEVDHDRPHPREPDIDVERWSLPIVQNTTGATVGAFTVRPAELRLPTADDHAVLDTAANLVAIAVERSRAEAHMVALALHDPLTGLPNRALLLDRLTHALQRLERRPTNVAVLFLDLDRFKTTNDAYGHAVGDELLVAVGHRLRAALRPEDTVARFAGDEFVIVCEDVADEAHAYAIAHRVESALAAPVALAEAQVRVTASVGIALTSSAAVTPESLLREADEAMYRAKQRGRNRVELFDAAMRDVAVARHALARDLGSAIGRDELMVHHLPIVDLGSGTVVGTEALVRWNHPQQGLLGPGAFMPVAEQTGLTAPIAEWVLDRALADAARWRDAGCLGGHELDVAVNVSARDLVRGDLPGLLAEVLARHRWPAGRLIIEVTEDVLVTEPDAATATLRAVRTGGVRVAVDDFGTGYASLAHLRRIPVDVVKIDGAFVAALDEGDTAVVRAVVGIAEALSLQTVAEGVSSAAQEAALRALGCRRAQGYLFSPPVPAEAMPSLLGR